MPVERALYIGRFQPFHNGHYNALKWILSQFDEVVLAIGSAQYSHTKENPMTVGERIECIWNQLRYDNLLHRVIITAVPDVGIHSQWVAVVKQYCPEFKVVFSNDNLTRLLFIENGYEVRSIPFFDRDKYEATKIREAIYKGLEWEKYVPFKIAEYIKIKKIDERIKSIFSNS
jgi:nicotinamide-nucleotide adenylyltransferase